MHIPESLVISRFFSSGFVPAVIVSKTTRFAHEQLAAVGVAIEAAACRDPLLRGDARRCAARTNIPQRDPSPPAHCPVVRLFDEARASCSFSGVAAVPKRHPRGFNGGSICLEQLH